MRKWTYGVLYHARFHLHQCISSTMRAEKTALITQFFKFGGSGTHAPSPIGTKFSVR